MHKGTSDLGFPDHFDGKRFCNPDAPPAVPGLLDALRWKLKSRPSPSPSFIADVVLRTTLVNHSTVLLQQRGVNSAPDEPFLVLQNGQFADIR